MDNSVDKNVAQENQPIASSQEMQGSTPLSSEVIGEGSYSSFEESGKNKRLILIVVAALLLLASGAAAYYFTFVKNKGQTSTYPRKQKAEQKTVENISPSPVATSGATVPTISDDLSIDTIEKELESLPVDTLDQGDASIESDLQNL